MAAFFVMPVMAQPALTSGADSGIAKLSYGPDRWIDVHLLFQMQYTNTFTWDPSAGAGETDSDGVWASNFAPKRMRVMFNGQVAPNVTAFVESDIYASTGTNQRYDLILQDAYINYKLAEEFNITFGMILLPFTHHNRESAVSLLGVNYNTSFVNIPETWNFWRDFGVEFRGLLANKMIDYRIGLFDGIERDVNGAVGTDDDINPQGLPRVTGRIQINLMDAEEGFFYSGNYLGKKRIVSFGGGIDYMKEATQGTDAVEDYMAWTVDAVVDYPINPNMVLAFQAAYTQYSWYPVTPIGQEEGYSYFAQAGLLLNGQFQPVLKYESVVAQNDAGDNIVTYLYVGFNYFINGHNANVKIEYRHPMGENEATNVDQADNPDQKVFTLQAQIFI